MSKSSETRNSRSHKFILPCQERAHVKGWLHIEDKLVEESPVLKGVLDKRKHVVVKYGSPETIKKDYSIAMTLHQIPNMINYYCMFECNDHIETIGKKSYVCESDGDDAVGYILMPHYAMGTMNAFKWTLQTFPLMKNVLKQICFAILLAMEKHAFVHNDLHLNNVLLRRTAKRELSYGDRTLPLMDFYAILMDFERSTVHQGSACDAYFTINKVLNLATWLDASDLSLKVDAAPINVWMSQNAPITPATYQRIESIIDGMTVNYEKSKRPPNPFLA